MDSARTLILSPWFTAYQVRPWQDAVVLVYLNKAEVIVEYDEVVRSPSVSMRVPAVIRLKKAIGSMKRGAKFSRHNVFTRDNFTCQYCLKKFLFDELNFDHVVPRHQGGTTGWHNIVASCYPCNAKKRNRTPEEAGMTLARKPSRPDKLPLGRIHLDPRRIHPLWEDYLKAG